MSATNLPKRLFPVPYQVDFSVESKGRHLDSTKKRIKWIFGFAHPPAVFPHLFDDNENYIGGKERIDATEHSSNSAVTEYSLKQGVECRGREHEIILTWSLISGKAILFVDNREVFRHDPDDEINLNPYGASFHKGFDLPDPEVNGRHRIDIRCYARTPIGAKNMSVDDMGGTFRQYDLTVDGLSYFSMPAMFELGSETMWSKVSNWGMMRRGSSMSERNNDGGGYHGGYGGAHTRGEDSKGLFFNMGPRDESEEEAMMRVAMQESLRELDNGGKRGKSKPSSINRSRTSSGDRHASSSSHRRKKSSDKNIRRTKSEDNKLVSVREDENLIDFGDDADPITQGIANITVSNRVGSDVSVLGDDDATTATFMAKTNWHSATAVPSAPPLVSQGPQYQQQYAQMGQVYNSAQPQTAQQQSMQPHFHDPTFNPNLRPYASSATTPRASSNMSFASPPPPTWDDYNNAFGGGMVGSVVGGGGMGSSVAGSTMMPPPPPAMGVPPSPNMGMAPSPRMGMPPSPNMNGALVPAPQYGGVSQFAMGTQRPQFYGAYNGGSTQTPVTTAPLSNSAKNSKFDPLRADPFAS